MKFWFAAAILDHVTLTWASRLLQKPAYTNVVKQVIYWHWPSCMMFLKHPVQLVIWCSGLRPGTFYSVLTFCYLCLISCWIWLNGHSMKSDQNSEIWKKIVLWTVTIDCGCSHFIPYSPAFLLNLGLIYECVCGGGNMRNHISVKFRQVVLSFSLFFIGSRQLMTQKRLPPLPVDYTWS
jgi:hypothetical protein